MLSSCAMNKRAFTSAERYAVWLHHEKRCWLCLEPLRFFETTIDHVLPESLLNDDNQRTQIFAQYGLPRDFQINSFANWLPCHHRCNQQKSDRVLRFAPGNLLVLERLISLARNVEQTAVEVGTNV